MYSIMVALSKQVPHVLGFFPATCLINALQIDNFFIGIGAGNLEAGETGTQGATGIKGPSE